MPIAESVVFICPKCRSQFYGSMVAKDGITLERTCHGCYSFKWNQEEDWIHFKVLGKFLNQEDYHSYKFVGLDGTI